ncbi:sce7725 family protein [Elizabethkingia bruuniana]|uniref:Sce7725 family protein n=1 Tax=Elizabethkingia bruuniana TaxID=1756149 RepID=A0A7T7ZZ97_9FLAO|nr:sce7725 family protein [Elizabethkingia bruuniana]QQN59380.1 sce7725 family protein [Elizabethkingia bruuniana]
MYFPFMFAKQNEASAIVELDSSLFQKITPVFMPNNTGSSKKNIQKIIKKNINFILVVNFQKKGFPTQKDIQDNFIDDILKDYSKFSLAYIVDNTTKNEHIDAFISSNQKLEKSLIFKEDYIDEPYIKGLKLKYNFYILPKVGLTFAANTSNKNSVLVFDGFDKQVRNSDYPTKSYFSDLHYTYPNLASVGFGDFTITGKDPQEGGSTPLAVALHLTKIDGNKAYVYHFVSDTQDKTKDVAGKFFESLNGLIKFVKANKGYSSNGISDFEKYHSNSHFPGLGVCKRMSMKHHLEILHNEI